jgi:hypothetical protein
MFPSVHLGTHFHSLQIGSVGLAEHDAAAKYPRVAIHFSRFTPLMHKMSGHV